MIAKEIPRTKLLLKIITQFLFNRATSGTAVMTEDKPHKTTYGLKTRIHYTLKWKVMA